MKEERIKAQVGLYGCLILAKVTEDVYFCGFWILMSIFWLGRMIYFRN